MKYSLTTREKNLIVVAFTVLFCSMFITYLVLPAWDSYNAGKVELEAASARLQQLKAAEQAAKVSTEDTAQIKEEIAQLRKQIPIQPDSAALLFYINKAAEKTGVVLNRLECAKNEDPAPGQADTAAPRAMFTRVSLTGTYAQVSGFIRETEKLTRLTHNKVISVNEVKDISKLEVLIEFDSFYTGSGSSEVEDLSDVPAAAKGTQMFKF